MRNYILTQIYILRASFNKFRTSALYLSGYLKKLCQTKVALAILLSSQNILGNPFPYDNAAQVLQQGNFQQAYNMLQPLITDNPDKADLLYDAGIAAYNLQKYTQAQTYFARAAEHADTSDLKSRALFNVGNTCVALKDLHKALEYYDAVLAIDEQNEYALYNKERVLEMLKQQEQQKQQNESNKDQEQEKNQNNKDDQQKDKDQQQSSDNSDNNDNQQQDNQQNDKQDRSQQQQDQQQNQSGDSQKNKNQQSSSKEKSNQEERSDGADSSERDTGEQQRNEQDKPKKPDNKQDRKGDQQLDNKSEDTQNKGDRQQSNNHNDAPHNQNNEDLDASNVTSDEHKEQEEQLKEDIPAAVGQSQEDMAKELGEKLQDPWLVNILKKQEDRDKATNKQLMSAKIRQNGGKNVQNNW